MDKFCRKTLENSLAQLNEEHVEILVGFYLESEAYSRLNILKNELVKHRLKTEEMEEELVRYKLL